MSKFSTLDFQLDKPYDKMSFRNRCIISGSQGMQTLSIPIRGGRGYRGTYASALIDDRQSWNIHHWRAIYSAYGRAPMFEFYASELEALFSRPPERLADWNLRCLQWLYKSLGIPFPDVSTNLTSDAQEGKMVNVTEKIWSTPQDFQSEAMEPFPRYQQVFQDKNGFLPNLSMLDFVLCAGPKTVRHWLSSRIHP